jgi:hypothetical protein
MEPVIQENQHYLQKLATENVITTQVMMTGMILSELWDLDFTPDLISLVIAVTSACLRRVCVQDQPCAQTSQT